MNRRSICVDVSFFKIRALWFHPHVKTTLENVVIIASLKSLFIKLFKSPFFFMTHSSYIITVRTRKIQLWY